MLIQPGVFASRLVFTLDTILARRCSLGVSLSGPVAGSLSLSGAEDDSGGEEVEDEAAGEPEPVLGGSEENPESAAAGEPRPGRGSVLLEPSRTENRKD